MNEVIPFSTRRHSIHYILDEDYNVVPTEDFLEWGRFFEDTANRRVDETYIGPYHISTVFMGLDHGWGDQEPQIFETMVFGDPLDEPMTRYSTWAEAMVGHEEACQWCRDQWWLNHQWRRFYAWAMRIKRGLLK